MDTLTPALACRHLTLPVESTRPTQFIDLTTRLERIICEAGLWIGLINVQTRHTTSAIVVNEHEPLLLTDFEEFLEGPAPVAVRYRHDDRVPESGRHVAFDGPAGFNRPADSDGQAAAGLADPQTSMAASHASPEQGSPSSERATRRGASFSAPADEERRNGHAHCRALLLPSSACLNVMEGRLQLGSWQRVFFVELDGPRNRELSLLVLGETRR